MKVLELLNKLSSQPGLMWLIFTTTYMGLPTCVGLVVGVILGRRI